MKKIHLHFIILTLAFCSFCPITYAATSSQDFRLVVYIPPIPGVNAPLEDITQNKAVKELHKATFHVLTEEYQEHGLTVVRKTIVAK